MGKYLLPPKSIPPLGNGFCRVISELAYNENGSGCRVFESNPAHLEVVTSSRSGPRGCLEGFAKDGNAFEITF
jgi:hypothetical protein